MSDKIQIKVTVNGRVQGVFYRAETKHAADKLGIKGYVKNLPSGSVEAVFEGNKPIVFQMIEWCNKGPDASKVENVQTKEIEGLSDFKIFKIEY
jgi:acylphosphatase